MPSESGNDERLAELFEAVADLDQAAREAWLGKHCDDPGLREDVRALCRSDSKGQGVLDQSSARLAESLIEPDEDGARTMLGARIGAWEITDLLGEGGMATVWLGERADGTFEQQVAIKCLKTALAGPAYRRLFDRERQILANLEHPGIAHLLDGGVTADGVPYIVMERVRGEPLLEACDARNLKLQQRLRLFLEICDIVQYAHQKLVLHRDLKPGNILIDEQGRPRLLDFGIAGLLDEASGGGVATRAVALTPGYAAPEQQEGRAAGVGADLYALGVILCELVTGGMHPEVKPGDDPVAHTACRPSQLVLGGSEHDLAWRRRRAGKLRGDLDAIVLQCLRDDPGERYASVADLSRDLDDHLAQRPVNARRGHWGYRATRFLRRHAAGLAATAVVLAVLVGALLWSLEQNRQTRAALAESKAAFEFMQGLFESNLPSGAVSALPSTAELLARGTERAQTEFDDKPRLQVRMLTAIGGIYRRLDQPENARRLLDKAMTIATAQAATAKPISDLTTRLQLGLLEYRTGRYKEAAVILEPVLKDRRRQDASAVEMAEALQALAKSRSRLGEHEAAIALQREAVMMLEQSEQALPKELASALIDLGGILYIAREFDPAVKVMRRALAENLRLYGRVHARTNDAANSLAIALGSIGLKQESLRMLREVVATDELIFKAPTQSHAYALYNLSIALNEAGQLFEARDVVQQTWRSFIAVFGTDHPMMERVRSVQAAVEFQLGHYAAAEEMNRKNLVAFKARDAKSYAVTMEQVNLALSLAQQGKLAEARELAHAAFDLRRELRGSEDRSLVTALAVLAWVERNAGNLDLARGHIERALKLNGDEHRNSAQALLLRSHLGYVRCLQGSPKGLTTLGSVLGSAILDPTDRAGILSFQGDCLDHLGQREQARAVWREALKLRNDRLPDDYPDSVRIRAQLENRQSPQDS